MESCPRSGCLYLTPTSTYITKKLMPYEPIYLRTISACCHCHCQVCIGHGTSTSLAVDPIINGLGAFPHSRAFVLPLLAASCPSVPLVEVVGQAPPQPVDVPQLLLGAQTFLLGGVAHDSEGACLFLPSSLEEAANKRQTHTFSEKQPYKMQSLTI